MELLFLVVYVSARILSTVFCYDECVTHISESLYSGLISQSMDRVAVILLCTSLQFQYHLKVVHVVSCFYNQCNKFHVFTLFSSLRSLAVTFS